MLIKTIIFFSLLLNAECFKQNAYQNCNTIREQSFMAGTYTKNVPYGDGDPISTSNVGDAFIKFDIGSRSLKNVDDFNDDESLYFDDIYAPAFKNYSFINYSTSRYLPFMDESNSDMFGPMWGPKDRYVNSTCKIRAYYHDILHNGLLYTVMYDFTGFLVGDSLLMTTAHGLYRDVTVGEFNDGIDNVYMPGKVEVYGAIGLADDWGSSYPYYAKVTEIYFDSSYISNPNFSDDWAVCRLDTPLGRELSFRRLNRDSFPDSSTYPFDPNKPDFERPANYIIGYPVSNQFHLRSEITNLSYAYTTNLYMYDCDSFDGMSGSPLYSVNIKETSNYYGDLRLKCREAYGIHVGYDNNTQTGYAIRITENMLYVVNQLNKIYEPQTLQIPFGNSSEIIGSNTERYFISNGYNLDVTLNDAYTDNNKLCFDDGINAADFCSATLEFDVPVSSISFYMDKLLLTVNSSVNMTIYDFYGNDTSIPIISPNYVSSSYKTIDFANPVKKIKFDYFPNGGHDFGICNMVINLDWDYIVPSLNSPLYNVNELSPLAPYENCASYAFRYLIENYTNGNDRGMTIGTHSTGFERALDQYPGKIYSCLRDECNYYGCDLINIDKYEACSHGGYKVCILCDPYNYYHVLRQNNDGYWSQYISCEGVCNYDSNFNQIKNPEKCSFVMSELDHSTSSEFHEMDFDLSTFVGFYELFKL